MLMSLNFLIRLVLGRLLSETSLEVFSYFLKFNIDSIIGIAMIIDHLYTPSKNNVESINFQCHVSVIDVHIIVIIALSSP